jgi:hypothetical protein
MDNETNIRRPGAQPGNRNALKHGFYSRYFKKIEMEDLAAITGSLDDEVAMLRIVTRRAFEYASQNEPGDLDQWIKLLGGVGAINTRIAALLRTKKMIEGGGDERDSLISAALADVMRSYGYGSH